LAFSESLAARTRDALARERGITDRCAMEVTCFRA
jgi:hypothetical protein